MTNARRLIALFFFLSGGAALLYEILWLRLLGLVFGNTTHAVSTILTVYMAGLGLGSVWIGRRADRWRRPVLAYGWMELGIGIYAAGTFLLIEGIQHLYVGFAQRFSPGPAAFALARLGLSFVILFIPTFFMGATLPLLAKFTIRDREEIGAGAALLYGLNTAGAVAGTLLAGFLLLPLVGMRSTLAMAVGLNIGIGLLALLLSRRLNAAGLESPPTAIAREPQRSDRSNPDAGRLRPWLLLGMGVSGMTAMAYEVGWTRVLAAVLGSSTYAFTVMLATFLLGIALGSAAAQRFLRRRPADLSDWALLQWGIAFSALITLPLFDRLGVVTVRLFGLTLGHPGWLEAARFLLCGALLFAPTFCFGALFPVSASLYARDPATVGRGLGTLYLANTLGNMAGSLLTGFLLIPAIGIHASIRAAVAAGGAIGCVAALKSGTIPLRRLGLAGLASLSLLGGLWALRDGWDRRLLTGGLHVKPWQFLGMDSDRIRAMLHDWEILFYREGANSIVSVEQYEERALRVNGKADASSGRDMETQVLSAHLPHLIHPHPRRSLVIGFGSGTTLRCSLAHPTVERADCAEIEPAVVEAAPFFDSINHGVVKNPRARLILNDGRNHLLVEQETYDCIISEPSNPWMAGVSSLFTVEFYELARRRLSPGGILCQWLQGYALEPRDFIRVIRTVRTVFPHVTLWHTLPVDFLIIAGDQPIVFDLDRIEERLRRSPQVRNDLAGFGMPAAAGLLACFQLAEEDVDRLVEGEDLNTDDHLALEFNAPWAMYKETQDLLQEILASHRRHPLPPVAAKGLPLTERPTALTQIGEALLLKGEISQAEDYFRRALALDPNQAASRVGLGRVHSSRNEILTAISLFEEGTRRDPKSAYAWGNLGWALWEGGDTLKGLQALKKAGELDPADWDTFFRQGTLLEELRRWPEAAAAYERAMQMKPDHLSLQIRYAHCLTESGRAEEAASLLETLRGRHKTHLPITEELSRAYEKSGSLPRAIAVREDLARLNPFRAENRKALARLYLKQGDRRKALEALVSRGGRGR